MLKNTMIITDEIKIEGLEEDMTSRLDKCYDQNGLTIYDIEFSKTEGVFCKPITLVWKIPAINVKGVWKPTADFSKRIHADWELEHMESRISIDAPVMALFGHDDTNILTFSCSDAIHKLEMNARIREEDNHFYCHITFFTEY